MKEQVMEGSHKMVTQYEKEICAILIKIDFEEYSEYLNQYHERPDGTFPRQKPMSFFEMYGWTECDIVENILKSPAILL